MQEMNFQQQDDHNESPQEYENYELEMDTNSSLLRPIAKGDILLEHEIEVGSEVYSMLLYAEDTKVLLGCWDGRLRGFEKIGLKKKLFDLKLQDDGFYGGINDL